MYYINLVRNIVNNIDSDKHLDNLRKHLTKSGVKFGYYMTKEVSPKNNQIHIHTIISLKTIEDQVSMLYYINKHHLKAYVDKCTIIEKGLKYYLKYIRKDLTVESNQYKDFDYKDYEQTVWDNIINQWQTQRIKAVEEVDDPFMDSDSDTAMNLFKKKK